MATLPRNCKIKMWDRADGQLISLITQRSEVRVLLPQLNRNIMGEDMYKNGKIMNAVEAQTIRELADFANDYKIPREDVVSILPSREGYVMVYYY